MITLEEATILHSVQSTGRVTKSQLTIGLHEAYGAAVNTRDLSQLVDGLCAKGLLLFANTLPRTYMIHPSNGPNELRDFVEAIDAFKDAVSMTRNKAL